ncbi:hypothetical protein [Streptomyces sp. NRRL F-5630]|uniref:hypothetical protein n=1 Tax=Streptomyces sp. NRRL F-5630 TaxID=1463864 RepID=UPI003D7538A7
MPLIEEIHADSGGTYGARRFTRALRRKRRHSPLHGRAADGRAGPGGRHPWPRPPHHGPGAVGAASAGPDRAATSPPRGPISCGWRT